MGFKVLTLDFPALKNLSGQLLTKIEVSGFVPDLVIGVPTGGARIADLVFESYPKASMTLIRPPKGVFKKRVSSFVKFLPMFLRDWLRILEAHVLVGNSNHMAKTKIVFPEIGEGVKCVLIVDDAVDSGATLKAVMNEFSRQFPDIEAKSAVFTITGAKTVYRPDFYLLDNQTLVRMPWSIDMK